MSNDRKREDLFKEALDCEKDLIGQVKIFFQFTRAPVQNDHDFTPEFIDDYKETCIERMESIESGISKAKIINRKILKYMKGKTK